MRGHNPFQPDRLVPVDTKIKYQDWITVREGGTIADIQNAPAPQRSPGSNLDQGGDTSGGLTEQSHGGTQDNLNTEDGPGALQMLTNPFSNSDSLKTLVEALHKEPTWKACVVEGTTWEGTAAENTQKYLDLIETQRTWVPAVYYSFLLFSSPITWEILLEILEHWKHLALNLRLSTLKSQVMFTRDPILVHCGCLREAWETTTWWW